MKNYNKADALVVLATSFKNDLREWGITKPIYLSTTKVDDELLKGFDIDKKQYRKDLLFLARIEDYKGIFITIEAFRRVKEKFPDATLKIAGTGSALNEAKDMVQYLQILDVIFLGNVSGDKLKNAFQESSIYILPTSHGEGMPTSVLEAMAFGLPVVTRPVGGLKDFFEDSKMGFLVDSLDPKDFIDKIEKLLANPILLQQISNFNYMYANKNFLASKVAQNLEAISEEVMS